MAQLPSEQEFGDYGEWPGRDVLDAGGDRLGGVREIYLDRETGRPEWVLVDVEGDEARFVPLAGAAVESRSIRVAHPSSVVRAAPTIGPEARIDTDQERRLYAHYGIGYSEDESPTGLPILDDDQPDASEDRPPAPTTEVREPEPPAPADGGPQPPAEPEAADLGAQEPPAPIEGGPPPPAEPEPVAGTEPPATDLDAREPPAQPEPTEGDGAPPEAPSYLGGPEQPAAAPEVATPEPSGGAAALGVSIGAGASSGGPSAGVPAPPPVAAGLPEPPSPVAGGPRPVEAPTPAPPLASPPLDSEAPEPPPPFEGGPQPPRVETPPRGGKLAVVRSKRSLGLAGAAAVVAAALFLVVRRLRS